MVRLHSKKLDSNCNFHDNKCKKVARATHLTRGNTWSHTKKSTIWRVYCVSQKASAAGAAITSARLQPALKRWNPPWRGNTTPLCPVERCHGDPLGNRKLNVKVNFNIPLSCQARGDLMDSMLSPPPASPHVLKNKTRPSSSVLPCFFKNPVMSPSEIPLRQSSLTLWQDELEAWRSSASERSCSLHRRTSSSAPNLSFAVVWLRKAL